MPNGGLFTTELTIIEIESVWNGIYMPRSNHMEDRAYHGLVLIRNDPHAYLFDDGTVLEAEAGYILYLPKGSSYRVSTIRSCDCVAINFQILEEVDFPPLRFSVGNQFSAYSELYQTASRFWDSRTIGYRSKIKSILYQILYLMQKNYHPDYVPSGLAFKLGIAMEYIGEHYTSGDITVQSLAEMTEMSEVYFRRQFHRLYGMAPLQYIKQLRMNRAIELLKSDMYPVHTVAHMVGYNSEYYFSREFKRTTGLSPMHFKKEKTDRAQYAIGQPCRPEEADPTQTAATTHIPPQTEEESRHLPKKED